MNFNETAAIPLPWFLRLSLLKSLENIPRCGSSRFDPQTRHVILGIKTWLSTLETVSLVGRGSSVAGGPLQNLRKFVYPTLPVSFGGDTIGHWSLLCASMPGEVKDTTQGVNVSLSSGLHILAQRRTTL